MESTYNVMTTCVWESVADLVFSSDLVKLIHTAHTPIGQDQGSSLQGKCPADRVPDH